MSEKFIQIKDGANNTLFPNINARPFNSNQFYTLISGTGATATSKISLQKAKDITSNYTPNLASDAGYQSWASNIFTSALGAVAVVKAMTSDVMTKIDNLCHGGGNNNSDAFTAEVAAAIVPTAKAVWFHTHYRNTIALTKVNGTPGSIKEGDVWWNDGLWMQYRGTATEIGYLPTSALYFCLSDHKFYHRVNTSTTLTQLTISGAAADWASITNKACVDAIKAHDNGAIAFYTTTNGTTIGSTGTVYASVGKVASATSADNATTVTGVAWTKVTGKPGAAAASTVMIGSDGTNYVVPSTLNAARTVFGFTSKINTLAGMTAGQAYFVVSSGTTVVNKFYLATGAAAGTVISAHPHASGLYYEGATGKCYKWNGTSLVQWFPSIGAEALTLTSVVASTTVMNAARATTDSCIPGTVYYQSNATSICIWDGANWKTEPTKHNVAYIHVDGGSIWFVSDHKTDGTKLAGRSLVNTGADHTHTTTQITDLNTYTIGTGRVTGLQDYVDNRVGYYITNNWGGGTGNVQLAGYAGSSGCSVAAVAGKVGAICYESLRSMYDELATNGGAGIYYAGAYDVPYAVPSAGALVRLLYSLLRNN